jgi:hypothetical protein
MSSRSDLISDELLSKVSQPESFITGKEKIEIKIDFVLFLKFRF